MTSITLPSSGAAAIRLNGLGNGFLVIICYYAPLPLAAIQSRDATLDALVIDPDPDLKVLIPSRERHAFVLAIDHLNGAIGGCRREELEWT
jgi:hypothetical protein